MKATYILNDLAKQLFEKIFGHEFVALADKLINTIDKEDNKINDLNDAVKIILNFSEVLSLDLT